MAQGTAHITTIEDPVDCSFLDKYVDWRKHLREPTERERWRDERIRRLLKPFLEPHAPLNFLPSSLESSGEKARTEAEDILEPALDRAEDFLLHLPDPLRWISKPSAVKELNPYDLDPVEIPDCSDNPEIAFERLVRRAREHRMTGEAYLAVVMYSRALYTSPPKACRRITLEAQDAAHSAGLWNSSNLVSLTWSEEWQSAEWTDQYYSGTAQQTVLNSLKLPRVHDILHDWAVKHMGEERVTSFLGLLRTIVARLHQTTFASPDKYDWILYIACTSQYFLLYTLRTPYGPDSPADDRGHEFITRVLFYLWDVVNSEIERKNGDTADLAFLRFRIAKSLLEIQPYLDSVTERTLEMPAKLRETDAIHGLGLSAETLHSIASFIDPLKSILITLHYDNVVLTRELCFQIVACLDHLVQRKDPLRIWDLLHTFRLADLGSGMGIGRRLHYLITEDGSDWEAIATREAISQHSLFTYNIATYHNSDTPYPPSAVFPRPPAPLAGGDIVPTQGLARLAFTFSVPRPGEEERLVVESCKVRFYRELLPGCNLFLEPASHPAYLQRIIAPYVFCFGWTHHMTRMSFVKRYTKTDIDEDDPWRLLGHAIGLGRVYLSNDNPTRLNELQTQIETLGQLILDTERLARCHNDSSADQRSLRVQLQLLLGESYLELSELSDPSDISVRRALEIFDECKRLATQLGHQEVTAASVRRLVDVQAKLWGLRRGGVRPEDIHSICLEAEILLRPRQNFYIHTSVPSLQGHDRRWLNIVADRLLPMPYRLDVIESRVGHIFAIASDISLSQRQPVDALCWIQRGKANITAGLITQQRSLPRFMSYLAGDRRRRPRSGKEFEKTWRQVVRDEESRSFIACARQPPTLAKSQDDLRQEIKRLRDTFVPRSSLFTGSGQRTRGRVVLADWSLASGTDAYCLCISSIPGIPQFFSVSIRPSEVRRWRGEHWDRTDKCLEMPERQSPLRMLDELISPLDDYLQTGDTVILCLTGDLHCLPIHALHLRNGLPLIYFHPVVHAPNLKVYLHCIQSCRHLDQKTRGAVPAMAAVYPSLSAQGPSPRHARLQQSLYKAVHEIAASLGADLYWNDAVTRHSLLQELQTRGVLFFIGHCISDSQAYMSVQHRLLLSNHELFSTTDFLDNNITPSLLVLLGCGTAQHTVPVGDEMMNLISGALVSGATSVLGTLWPIRVETAVMFARSLSGNLKAKEHVVDGQLIDVARAMQRAILELRESHSRPVDWAGYVLHGSPVMRDIFPRAGEGAVEATEGN